MKVRQELSYEPTDAPIWVQGTAVGRQFNRTKASLPDGTRCMQPRQVQIVIARDERGSTMTTAFIGSHHPPKDDFPFIFLAETKFLRHLMDERDVETVRKHGASRAFWDVDPRRGQYQVPKPERSFGTYIGPPTAEHPQVDKSRLPF